MREERRAELFTHCDHRRMTLVKITFSGRLITDRSRFGNDGAEYMTPRVNPQTSRYILL